MNYLQRRTPRVRIADDNHGVGGDRADRSRPPRRYLRSLGLRRALLLGFVYFGRQELRNLRRLVQQRTCTHGPRSAVNVAVNASEVCALRSDRTVRCRLWTIYPDGPPNQGMGQPRVKDYTPSVSDVSSLDLNGGGSQDCAVLFSGAVTCWSPPRNIYGSGTTTRLNIGAKASASPPSMGAHQCALLTTGEVTCVSSMPAFRGDGTTDTRFYNVEDMRLGESKVIGVSDAYAISLA